MKKLFTDLPEFISDYNVSSLVNLINEQKENEVELSWLSYGGSFWAGQKFIDYLNNSEKQVTANGTGIIASMGAVIFAAFNKNKVAYQSDFMIHSVGGEQNNIDISNEFIYNALAKKINEAKFKEITGHDLKKVLTAKGDERINVWFTGKDAVEMGLADEGYDLLEKNNVIPKIKVTDLGYEIPETIKDKYNYVKPEIKNNMDIKALTVETLQKENSAVYESAFNKGVNSEKERVSQIVKYASHNPEKMNNLIQSGKSITLEEVAELSAEKANIEKLNHLEDNSPADFVPEKPTNNTSKTDKEVALIELRKELGIDKF